LLLDVTLLGASRIALVCVIVRDMRIETRLVKTEAIAMAALQPLLVLRVFGLLLGIREGRIAAATLELRTWVCVEAFARDWFIAMPTPLN
jgi:hypothetical protein